MNNNYLPNRVRVTVNGAVYEIPTNKVGELQSMLAMWQSIQTQQPNEQYNPNGNGVGPKWNGTQLING